MPDGSEFHTAGTATLNTETTGGSVLGPILFLLYCADVTNIAERHGVTAHSYADDTQLYDHRKTREHSRYHALCAV